MAKYWCAWSRWCGPLGRADSRTQERGANAAPAHAGLGFVGRHRRSWAWNSAFQAGDEIYGVTNPNFCGAYTEYAIASAAMVARKPQGLSHVEAASVPVMAVTAWQMLFDYAQANPGQTILIHGAAGNVGAYAVQLAPEAVKASTLAGEPITARLMRAPGNSAPIGGLKVVTASGWFAARPSGTSRSTKSTRRVLGTRRAWTPLLPRPSTSWTMPCNPLAQAAGSAGGTAMSDNSQPTSLSPFPPGYRAAGVLLHVTSLPSPYGIGDAGRRHWRGSTASMRQARAGGRRCHWVLRGMATRRINPYRLSPATGS